MNDRNEILIEGRIVNDPEMKGDFLNFKIASNKYYKKADEWVQKTTWIPVSIYVKDRDVPIFKSVRVRIVGSIETRSWMDDGGQKKSTTGIFAKEIEVVAG